MGTITDSKPRWQFERLAAVEGRSQTTRKRKRPGLDKRDYGPDEGRADVNIYASSWKSPYGPEHRRVPQPQRLAAVMRVIGRPLSIMRKWPEVPVLQRTPSETVERSDKPKSMAEQKAIAAHRAALEKTIERLAARRDPLKLELDNIEAELKTLLSMLKAAGPIAGEEEAPTDPTTHKPVKGSKGKPKAAVKDKKQGSLTLRAITMSTVAKGDTTPASLAKAAGIDPLHASNVLGALARAGEIKRISRGVYGVA